MESSHELIYALTDGTKDEREQREKLEAGELVMIGAMLPSQMEFAGMPLVAQQAERWARYNDGKLGKLYELQTDKDPLKNQILELISQRGILFEEYQNFLAKGSSGVYLSTSSPLSKQDYIDQNPIEFWEQKFHGNPEDKEGRRQHEREQKELREKKERQAYLLYKTYRSTTSICSSVSKLHAFNFLEEFYRRENSYNPTQKVKDFLDYNQPDMEGYTAFIEKMAKVIPKPFERLYKRHACYIPTKSLQLHSYITGSTGSGKTETIKFIIHSLNQGREKAKYPRSLVVIEPDYKMCHEIARHKNFDRENTFLFDVELDGRTIEEGRKLPAYNPFDFPHKDIASIDKYAQSLANAFEGAIKKDFTPHMKDILKSCFMVLLRWEGATLTHDLFNMLSEDKCQPYIDFALKHLESDEREIFEKDFSSDSFNYTKSSLRVKFRSLFNPVFRRVIGQQKSTFDIEKIVNEGGIGLFALRGLGREAGSLLGSLLMERIRHTCFEERKQPHLQKPETFLFVDECHNYINNSIDIALSEGRKNKIYLSLASQFQGKAMSNDMTETVLTNTNLRLCGKVPSEKQPQTAKVLGISTEALDTLGVGEFFMKDANLTSQRKAFKIYVPTWYIDTRGQIEGEEWGAFKIEQLNTFYTRSKVKKVREQQRRKRPESAKDRAERVQGELSASQEGEQWAFDE